MVKEIPTYLVCVNKNVAPSATKLANELGAQLITTQTYPVPSIKELPLIINYGRSAMPTWYGHIFTKGGIYVNRPESVAAAVDKTQTSLVLQRHGISCVTYTKDKDAIQEGMEVGIYNRVMVRKTITSKGGKGIIVVDNPEDLDKYEGEWLSPLVEKDVEFRVHVAFGQAIEVVQKKRMSKVKLAANGLTKANDDIRNHANGWVFARNNLTLGGGQLNVVKHHCIQAVAALGLDFGAVDVLVDTSDNNMVNQLWVAEVNTAPGLDATATLAAYTKAFSAKKEKFKVVNNAGLLEVPGAELVV